MTGPIDPRRLTTLYRLFDASGRLLYVGTTVDGQKRWEQHAREKLWWSSVARAIVDWHQGRKSAMDAELAAIKSEKPLYNDKGTPNEDTFPYQGNRGPGVATLLRRAVVDHQASLDRLAVAVDRAARGGMSVPAIAESSGLTEADVWYLSDHLRLGGGIGAIAKHTPYSREWARKIADRIDLERAGRDAE